jgi:hypothetical protein
MAKKKTAEPADDGSGEPDAPQLPKRLIRDGEAWLKRAVFNDFDKRRHLGNVPKERLLSIVTNGEEGSATNADGTTKDNDLVHGIIYFFDVSPIDQNGKVFSGNDPSWRRDPQPSAGGLAASHEGDRVQAYTYGPGKQPAGVNAITPMRLCAPGGEIIHAEIDPAQYAPPDTMDPEQISADLNREYINYGCTPVIAAWAGPRQGAIIPIEGFHGPDYGDGQGPAIIPVKFRGPNGKVYDVTAVLVGRGA